MSLIELRKELHRMTTDYAISDHANRLKTISESYPNSIQILEPEIPTDCRCLSYAVGLAQNAKYIKIQRSSEDTIKTPLFADKEYLEWLVINERLEELSTAEIHDGNIVLYFEENEWRHAGKVIHNDRIASKWGAGLLYEHGPLETPANYGSELRYFKNIEPDYAYQIFTNFVVEKTKTNNSDDLAWWLSQCGITRNH